LLCTSRRCETSGDNDEEKWIINPIERFTADRSGVGRMSSVKRVLFVCVENANRSQMAEAFARILGGAEVEAYSAGSRPSGSVNPRAIEAMRELGYDLSAHGSKSLDELPEVAFDFVATMGCGDACPMVRARQRADWSIPDPKHLPADEFRVVRDMIRDRVQAMLDELGPPSNVA
jgi:protein-tyrosine-phosphatase